MSTLAEVPPVKHRREVIERAVIRFAGDSGDGMQITGSQFTNTVALYGNDIATFPDYPAEIRAPAGTIPGVSGFQLHFSSNEVYTPGDAIDVLIAMNPAALKVNVGDLKANGILIINSDSFKETDLRKAQMTSNPLEDHSLDKFRLFPVELQRLTRAALQHLGLDATPGLYRNVSGNQALALGFVTAAQKSGLSLFLGSYPITPASDILHELSQYKNFGVITFQAEDEIAAITSAIGASYSGALAITATSGPGMALKTDWVWPWPPNCRWSFVTSSAVDPPPDFRPRRSRRIFSRRSSAEILRRPFLFLPPQRREIASGSPWRPPASR